MPWTKPLNNPARVTAAGKIISGRKRPNEEIDLDTALSIAGNWRSAHGYPLHVFKILLRNRARNIDSLALVAQRLKRLPSIVSKLKRFGSMQLSTMQDLGGCRAVVRTVTSVERLVDFYEKNPTAAAKLIGKRDYIKEPKLDGYRGIHMIYEYQGTSQAGAFAGLKLEVQFRSRHQHAWATAVETIDTFSDQALKSGLGNDQWKRFFALMSTAMAFKEKRPLVPGTPTDPRTLCDELRPLCIQLRVPDVFYGLAAGIDAFKGSRVLNPVAYILELDSEVRMTRTYGFTDNEEAAKEYLRLEKEHLGKVHIQTVLVSVDSIASLKEAYPNYYLDTELFTNAVMELIS